MEALGGLAALVTSLCWVVSAISFEFAGKRLGSLSLNVIRLSIALVLLTLWGATFGAEAWPSSYNAESWLWLGASAICGFVAGDYCLFRAFAQIGARLSSLIMASTPVWTSLIGWAVLDERLSVTQLLGITITMGGIAVALATRQGSRTGGRASHNQGANKDTHSTVGSDTNKGGAPQGNRNRRVFVSGILLATVGAWGQASGLILSKVGMANGDAAGATQIRVMVGLFVFSVLCTALRWWPKLREGLRDTKAIKAAGWGSLFGPFVGVTLSLFAVQHIAAGPASTLMATTPVWLIPVSMWRGERVGKASIAGTVIAILGVAVLLSE